MESADVADMRGRLDAANLNMDLTTPPPNPQVLTVDMLRTILQETMGSVGNTLVSALEVRDPNRVHDQREQVRPEQDSSLRIADVKLSEFMVMLTRKPHSWIQNITYSCFPGSRTAPLSCAPRAWSFDGKSYA